MFVMACLVLVAAFWGQTVKVFAVQQRSDQASWQRKQIPLLEVNSERTRAMGIRQLESRHLILYTDLAPSNDVDQLPLAIDLAVDQWANFFGVPRSATNEWQLQAFLIQDVNRFRQAGLLPNGLPDFPAGINRGNNIWLYSQPGEYYTRHLLLHEGTHAFMEAFLGGVGSPWYAEGMAEKMGLHHWYQETEGDENALPRLSINFRVENSGQVPHWGRVKLIRGDCQQEQRLSLEEVLRLPPNAFREARFYGWAWAACEFLATHPSSQEVFASWSQQLNRSSPAFDQLVKTSLQSNWNNLVRDWELFIDEIDYGSDARAAHVAPAKKNDPVPLEGQSPRDQNLCYRISSSLAWQITNIQLQPGTSVHVKCRSRFQVGHSLIAGQLIPWESTANGITLHYYRGRPLGQLLVGTIDESAAKVDAQIEGLRDYQALGTSGVFTATRPGRVCFRINESPARMNDNQGDLDLEIQIVQ